MEKIVLGVPYEISIEPSIDIGDFDAHLIVKDKDFDAGIQLKKIKGKNIHYSFIVPNSLEQIFNNKTVKYSILVTKDNARFEVDKGDIQFISEANFAVNNLKMIAQKQSEPKKSKPAKEVKKKVTKKKTAVKESSLLDNTSTTVKTVKPSKVDEAILKAIEEDKKEASKVSTFDKLKQQSEKNKDLTEKLNKINERNSEREKRDEINKKIRESLKDDSQK